YQLEQLPSPRDPFPFSQCQQIFGAAKNITFLGTCFLVIVTMLGNSDASSSSTPRTCHKTKKHESGKCYINGCKNIVEMAEWRWKCPYKQCNQPGCREKWTPTKQVCLVCQGKK
ncbi:hypothetical protein PSTT_10379, partial [Puccinia striiformis]